MPPPLLIDLDKIDLNQVIHNADAIEKINPHRFEMRQLDGIVYLDLEGGMAVGFKDVAEDEFWVRGHIPGRPLMPGVLMIEAAAQLSSFCVHKMNLAQNRFFGFGGIEDVKFRAQVDPGSRLYLLTKFLEIRPRRFKMATQGIVNGQLAFQATIIGMPI
jgi:3-hydroxyacyl-[acyl-carrier-protein] dehydratase